MLFLWGKGGGNHSGKDFPFLFLLSWLATAGRKGGRIALDGISFYLSPSSEPFNLNRGAPNPSAASHEEQKVLLFMKGHKAP